MVFCDFAVVYKMAAARSCFLIRKYKYDEWADEFQPRYQSVFSWQWPVGGHDLRAPSSSPQSQPAGGAPNALTLPCTAPMPLRPSPPWHCPTSSTPPTGSPLTLSPSCCARWAQCLSLWGFPSIFDLYFCRAVLYLGFSAPNQVMRHENSSILELDGKEVSEFTPSKPREKWLRKRTHVKIRVGVRSSLGIWIKLYCCCWLGSRTALAWR